MSPHAVQAAPRLSHKLPGMFLDPLFCPQLPPGVLAELALNILLCCAPSPSITALHAQDQRRETCALLTDIIAHLEAQFPAVKTALADSTLGLQPLRASDLRLAPALQGLCAALRVLYADPIRATDFLRYAHAVLDEPTPLRPARDAQPLHPCVERSFDAPLLTALWFAGDTFLIDPPYPRDRGGWWGDWEALSFWCRLEAERVEADLRLLQLQPALFIDPFPTVVSQLQELGNDLWQRGLAADRQSARRIDELAAFCMLTSMWYGSALVDD